MFNSTGPIFGIHSAYLYSGLYIISTSLFVMTAYWFWAHPDAPARDEFLFIQSIGACWCGATLLQVIFNSPMVVFPAFLADLTFGSIIPPAWLLFVRKYTGYHRLVPKWLIGVSVVATILNLYLTLFNPGHFYFHTIQFVTHPYTTYVGPLTILHGAQRALAYLTIGYGTTLLFHQTSNVRGISRWQLTILTLSSSIPSVLGIGRDAGLLQLTVRQTVVGMAIFTPISILAIYRFDLFSVAPIARSKIFDTIDDAVIITDQQNTILRYTPGELDFLPDSISPSNDSLFDVLPTELRSIDGVQSADSLRTESTITTPTGQQHLDIDIEPLTLNQATVGRIITIYDATELTEQRRELERQNERLEQFASTLSHDLRNPLNVADAYLKLAEESGDPDHFETISDSYTRMESLIEDVLTLARDGQTISNPESVPLASQVETAWSHVETESDLVLDIPTDYHIQSDPSRLNSLFENLFRNAEEHANADTITVGLCDDGFYVEDDGSGISDADTDTIFDHGYTTDADGTGFGLSIVQAITEAHGWTVHAETGSDGGAKFVFNGVSE